MDLGESISMALARSFRIVQLDECLVTKRTLPTHVWTLPKQNAEIDMKDCYTPARAIIVAASREYGVDHVEIHPNSINKRKFKSFLENLRNKYPFDNIILVMDNLSLHKSNEVKERMDELGFMYCWTPVYSPRYNGIEEIINIGKQEIKKKRLDAILNGKEIDLDKLILKSFENINVMSISGCINRSLSLLSINN